MIFPKGLLCVHSPAVGGWVVAPSNLFPIGQYGNWAGPYETQDEAYTQSWLFACLDHILESIGLETMTPG